MCRKETTHSLTHPLHVSQFGVCHDGSGGLRKLTIRYFFGKGNFCGGNGVAHCNV